MEQVVANAQAQVAGEMADFDEDTGVVTPREVPPSPEPTPEPDDEVILTPAKEETPAEPPKPRMVPIVVDGQTLEVEEQRVIDAGKRTLQKESAADRRLAEANRMRQEAEEIFNRAKALQPRASQDPAQPNQAPSQDAPQQPAIPVDPATLINVIGQHVTQQVTSNLKAQQAVEAFRQEFPDIASDPYLWNMAATLEQKRLDDAAALGEPLEAPLDAYRKHGAEIRAWTAKFSPAPAAAAPAQAAPTDRQERKRTITAIPAVNAKAPAPQVQKPLTPSEEIERMRQERKAWGRPINQISR